MSASNLYDGFDHTKDEPPGPEALPMPLPKAIQQACVNDPVAAAEYFDKMSNFFIEKVLGWDPVTHRSVKDGGLFGFPQAYAAGIETQGCSLLHFHMLIWLENMPHTAAQEEEYEDYNQHLALYIDSIVTNDLPISVLFRFASEIEDTGAELSGPLDSIESESAFLNQMAVDDYCGSNEDVHFHEVKVNFSYYTFNLLEYTT
jgi:hypothetical protein